MVTVTSLCSFTTSLTYRLSRLLVALAAEFKEIEIKVSEAQGAAVIGALSAVFLSIFTAAFLAADAQALKLAALLFYGNVTAIGLAARLAAVASTTAV